MPSYTGPEKKQVEARYKKAVSELKALGFTESKATKSKIFSLVLVNGNIKAYISIRHDYERDVSATIGEFYCKTKTDTDAVGGETNLIRFSPRNNTVKFYHGIDLTRCKLDFIKMAAYFIKAVDIAKIMYKL